MTISWNALELGPPPNRSILTTNHGITDLKNICTNFKNILEHQKNLHVEAALLSRMLYRMKTKLRRDKGFQSMEKVNRCLLNYLKLNLASIYSNFTSCIRNSIDSDKTNKIYAPTKQMLEYLLLRTQGFAKLMSRIVQVGEIAGKYLINRINVGHSWNLALVSVSIIARIRSLSKYLILAACEHYNKLRPYLERLNYVGTQWANEDINFPRDLKEWLNVEWLSESYDNRNEEINGSESVLDKMFTQVTEVSPEKRIVDDQREIFHCKAEKSIDFGERVSRTDIQSNAVGNDFQPSSEDKGRKKMTLSKEKNLFENIKSTNDLIKFVRHEEKLRMSQRDAAITKNMDSFQFHLFTNKIHKVVSKLSKIYQEGNKSHFETVLKKKMKVLKLYVNL